MYKKIYFEKKNRYYLKNVFFICGFCNASSWTTLRFVLDITELRQRPHSLARHLWAAIEFYQL